MKIRVAIAVLFFPSIGFAQDIDRQEILRKFGVGDSTLVCFVHENVQYRARCEEIARNVDSARKGDGKGGADFIRNNPVFAAAVVMPECRSLDGIEADQCNIRATLKNQEAQPQNREKAKAILDIIGRGN